VIITAVYSWASIALWKVTRDALHLDQRAWVSAQWQFVPAQQQGQWPGIRVPLLNTGKSPAYEAKWQVGPFQVKRYGEPPEIKLSGEPIGIGPIPPGTSTDGIISWDTDGIWLTEANFEERRQRHEALFVYGTVRYRDIFGGEHFSEFCSSIIRFTPSGKNEFILCPIHNNSN
jgi:hypothetical protein